jgi:hypothetical protein
MHTFYLQWIKLLQTLFENLYLMNNSRADKMLGPDKMQFIK